MLALILSPLGRWLAAAALAGMCIAGAYIKGRSDRAALDQSAALRATVASLQSELRSTAEIAKASAERAQAQQAEIEATTRKVQDYEAELAKRPPALSCVLDDRDVRDFNGLRNGAAPGKASPPRAPREFWSPRPGSAP